MKKALLVASLLIISLHAAFEKTAFRSMPLLNTLFHPQYSPNGQYIAVLDSQILRILAADTLEDIAEFPLGTAVVSLAWTPNNEYLAIGIGRESNQIKIYKNNKQGFSWPVAIINGDVLPRALAWSPDSHHLATPNLSGDIQVYRMENDQENNISFSLVSSTPIMSGTYFDGLSRNHIRGTSFNNFKWSHDGRYLAVGIHDSLQIDRGAVLEVYQVRADFTLNRLSTLRRGGMSFPFTWSPDSRHLALAMGVSGRSQLDIFVVRDDMRNFFTGYPYNQLLLPSLAGEAETIIWMNSNTLAIKGGLLTDPVKIISIKTGRIIEEFSLGAEASLFDYSPAADNFLSADYTAQREVNLSVWSRKVL